MPDAVVGSGVRVSRASSYGVSYTSYTVYLWPVTGALSC